MGANDFDDNEYIGNFTKLETLKVQENSLNRRLPQTLNKLLKLRTIVVAGNHFSCEAPMMDVSPELGKGIYQDGEHCI